jgi:hypothetical protein
LVGSGEAVRLDIAAEEEIGVDVSVGVGEDRLAAIAFWESEKGAIVKLIANMARAMPIFNRSLCVVSFFRIHLIA